MTQLNNPALTAFLAVLGEEFALAQVLIRRSRAGFELRHVGDAGVAAGELQALKPEELRAWAQFTAAGAFRPLKSAPNLRRGWRLVVADSGGIEGALNVLYPGAIADWYAVQSAPPPVTHYREFTARQTGMYRATTMLDDAGAERVVRASCDGRFCLKRRWWTVGGLAVDPVADKSCIPCLEPCPILLELARKAVRIEQEDKVKLELAPEDGATILAVLAAAVERPNGAIREGDTGSPENPRRVLLLWEKLRPLFDVPKAGSGAE